MPAPSVAGAGAESVPADAGTMNPYGYELRVAQVVRETADTCSIVFDVPHTLEPIFRYRAGQFLTLRIPFEGKELSRSYSLASSPDVDREFKITVKRVPGGRISNWVNDRLRAGDMVRVMPPGGLFVLDGSSRPLLFFAAGSGITPVVSLIKSSLACTERPVRLVYANRDESSVIFKRELDALASRYEGRLEIVHHLDVERGLLDVARAVAFAAEVPDAEVYVCGPAAFMQVVQAALTEAGVPDSRVRVERFASPPDPSPEAEHPMDAGEPPQTATRVTVYLDGRTHEVICEPGQTVLAAVQQKGLEPPFSCTDGFCGCCMARLRAGKVRMIKNDFLSHRELQEGWVLTCQSLPQGDGCEIEYPD